MEGVCTASNNCGNIQMEWRSRQNGLEDPFSWFLLLLLQALKQTCASFTVHL